MKFFTSKCPSFVPRCRVSASDAFCLLRVWSPLLQLLCDLQASSSADVCRCRSNLKLGPGLVFITAPLVRTFRNSSKRRSSDSTETSCGRRVELRRDFPQPGTEVQMERSNPLTSSLLSPTTLSSTLGQLVTMGRLFITPSVRISQAYRMIQN
jgi:hypothetical protein